MKREKRVKQKDEIRKRERKGYTERKKELKKIEIKKKGKKQEERW